MSLFGLAVDKNPFRTTLKPWLKPLFVDIYTGIKSLPGCLDGGVKWISSLNSTPRGKAGPPLFGFSGGPKFGHRTVAVRLEVHQVSHWVLNCPSCSQTPSGALVLGFGEVFVFDVQHCTILIRVDA